MWVVLLVTGFVGLAKFFGLLVTEGGFMGLVLFAGLGSAVKGLVMCLDGCEVGRAGWRGTVLRFLLQTGLLLCINLVRVRTPPHQK